MTSDPEVESALSRVRIFASLPRRDLRRLSAMCLLERFAAGETILKEGSTGLGLFLITSGRVDVFKTLAGRKIPLAVLKRGDVLGEMALLDDQPRSASAVALEATECLLLSRGRFRTLLQRRPRVAWPIVPALAGRVRDLQAQVLEAEERTPATPADPAVAEPGEPDEPDEPAAAAAGSAAASEGSRTSGKSRDDAGRNGEPDLLRTPYALVMAGAAGLGESVRLLEVFLRSLDEESGLSGGRPMGDVVRGLPASLVAAGMSSWDRGRKVPSKVLGSFRDHLRSDRPRED